MKSPHRLSENDSDLSSFEQELLSIGSSAGPNSADKAAMWAAISAQATVATTATVASTVAAKKAVATSGIKAISSWGLVAKTSAVVSVATAVAVSGGAVWTWTQTPEKALVAPSASVPPFR